jgi:hypothetical protein
MILTVAAIDVATLVGAPVVAALVAIFLTGTISAGLSRRAASRTLRGRLARLLLLGAAREQEGWWYATDEELTDLEQRIVGFGDEVVVIDVLAAEAIWHAAQMVPVLRRCRTLYDDAVRGIQPAIEKASYEPENYRLESVRKVIAKAIEQRDAALDALSHVYQDLLQADKLLARVSRWLRIIDRAPELEPPATFVAAAGYLATLLDGTVRWQEPKFEVLEILRIHSVAQQIPPPSNIPAIDAQLTRRNLLGPDDPMYDLLSGAQSTELRAVPGRPES